MSNTAATDLVTTVIGVIGGDMHDVRAQINAAVAKTGDLTTLSTTAKDTIVNALNEIKGNLTSLSGSAINAAYVDSAVASAITGLKDNAPAVLDTIGKIAAELAKDESATAAMLTAIAGAVRFDIQQALTPAQQAQAMGNIGAAAASDLGNVAAFNPLAAYTAKRDAA